MSDDQKSILVRCVCGEILRRRPELAGDVNLTGKGVEA